MAKLSLFPSAFGAIRIKVNKAEFSSEFFEAEECHKVLFERMNRIYIIYRYTASKSFESRVRVNSVKAYNSFYNDRIGVMKRCVLLTNYTRVMKTPFHTLIDPLADSAWRLGGKRKRNE